MNLYKDVWSAMNACNGSGFLTTWQTKWRDLIWEEVRANGGGTEEFNRHPVNIVCADKMLQLAGIHLVSSEVQVAYGLVMEKANA